MPKTTPGSGPSRRPRTRAGVSPKSAAPPTAEGLRAPSDSRDETLATIPAPVVEPPTTESASQQATPIEEGTIIELPAHVRKPLRPRKYKPSGTPRFRIFIIDSGWNSVVRRVLRHNFALIRRLHKEDPIYLLSRKKSTEFIHRHQSLIGRDPIIAVHDLVAMAWHGTAGFHGFHLHLGIQRTPREALVALQAFARFLATHRQSANLEADIRTALRREGIQGAVEILLQKVPRVIGG
jgi:hypothetical protein